MSHPSRGTSHLASLSDRARLLRNRQITDFIPKKIFFWKKFWNEPTNKKEAGIDGPDRFENFWTKPGQKNVPDETPGHS